MCLTRTFQQFHHWLYFCTDCNGATVGSVLGMANGMKEIPEYWYKPINDILHTTIFGVGTVKISDRVKITMEHIEKLSDITGESH